MTTSNQSTQTTEIPTTMRAWRTHVYGNPLEVLKLDNVDVPTPEEGELLVHVQAIPLNLNDLAAGKPEVIERLAEALAAVRETAVTSKLISDAETAAGVSAEDLEELRSLGYLQ